MNVRSSNVEFTPFSGPRDQESPKGAKLLATFIPLSPSQDARKGGRLGQMRAYGPLNADPWRAHPRSLMSPVATTVLILGAKRCSLIAMEAWSVSLAASTWKGSSFTSERPGNFPCPRSNSLAHRRAFLWKSLLRSVVPSVSVHTFFRCWIVNRRRFLYGRRGKAGLVLGLKILPRHPLLSFR